MTTLSIKKCPCGHRACNKYYVDGLWGYLQGAGTSKEVCLKIVIAMTTTFPNEYEYDGMDPS